MATISNTPRPGYVWDSTDNVWYPIGVGNHNHSEIQKTIVDAKGDLIVGTANDTVARQAVGTDGQTLIADSTQTNGVRWTDQLTTAGKNAVINGGMDIWQRGTSINTSSSNVYSADRWSNSNGSGVAFTVSRQATGDTTNLPNIQYCARVQRNSGNTNTSNFYFLQSIESANSIPLAGKAVILSFYARKGANFSSTSNILGVSISTGTGTDQSLATGYTGQSDTTTNVTLTTTWQRFTLTATIGSTATEMGVYFTYAGTGTAGANDYYEITGVQLELGSVATPFARTGGTIQGELAACQRYYWRSSGGANYMYVGAVGNASSTTNAFLEFQSPVTMRSQPTSIDYSTLMLYDGTNVYAVTAIAGDDLAASGSRFHATVASGLTQYRTYTLNNNASVSGYLGFSAEL